MWPFIPLCLINQQLPAEEEGEVGAVGEGEGGGGAQDEGQRHGSLQGACHQHIIY